MIISEVMSLTGASKPSIYRWMEKHPTIRTADPVSTLGHFFPRPVRKEGRVVHWDDVSVSEWWDKNKNTIGRHPEGRSALMYGWRPLWECQTDGDFLRRVIMSGHYRESGQTYPKVGEAVWCNPDEQGARWQWAGGGDVVNPLGFQDLPDFPIIEENDQYVVGRLVT